MAAAPFLACMMFVSSFYHLPPRALPSIQAVEGGRPGLVSFNTNGTEDLGVMQVNSIWVGPVARVNRMPPGAVRLRLLHDPCFNIATAGAILRMHLNETRGNLLRAIGNYHSRTPVRNQAYQEKVLSAAEKMFPQR